MKEMLKDTRFNAIIWGYILIVLTWYSFTAIEKMQHRLEASQAEVTRQSEVIALQLIQLQKLEQYKQYDRILKDLARHTN